MTTGPHFIPGARYVRGVDGAAEKRTASLRLRLEPTLLRLARIAADQDRADRWRDGRGAGASAYVRALIVADLERRGLVDRNGGSVQPHAGDASPDLESPPAERSLAETVCADLEATLDDHGRRHARERLDSMLAYELDPAVRSGLVALDQRWADQGI